MTSGLAERTYRLPAVAPPFPRPAAGEISPSVASGQLVRDMLVSGFLVALLMVGCQAAAAPTQAPLPPGALLQQSGAGAAQTATFDAPETWALDYSYDCGGAPVTQVLIQARSANAWEQILGNGGQQSASGTTYGHGAGPTYLDVSISCRWTITVRPG